MTTVYYLSTPHDRGVQLNVFRKDTTSKFAGFVFALSLMVTAKQESVAHQFYEVFDMIDPESMSWLRNSFLILL